MKKVTLISEQKWSALVRRTYNRKYDLQQQDGCMPRGIVKLTIPCKYTNDEEMHDSIPYKINGKEMGVKFKTWLERDPKDGEALFWERNFYPDINTVANDLHKKGLLKAGEYVIEIDW